MRLRTITNDIASKNFKIGEIVKLKTSCFGELLFVIVGKYTGWFGDEGFYIKRHIECFENESFTNVYGYMAHEIKKA